MRSQKEEPMAAIQLSYHKILVPLSIAHQLQALLTQATLVTSNYGTPNKQYTLELDYEVPNVEVWRTPRVLFDAKGMGAPQVRNWEGRCGRRWTQMMTWMRLTVCHLNAG